MLNPYVEILARALFHRNTQPIEVPFEDERKAIDAVAFMNCRTFTGVFRYSSGYVTLHLDIT